MRICTFLVPAILAWSVSAQGALPAVRLTLDAAATTQEAATAAPEEAPVYGIRGIWFGTRDELAKRHIFVDGLVFLDGAKVLRGGLDTEKWPVSYLLALRVTAQLDDDTDTFAVGFVADAGNAFDDFLARDFAEAFEQLPLVHLIRDFMDDDHFLFVALGHLNRGFRAHRHGAAACHVGSANAHSA